MIIAGNWKMYKDAYETRAFLERLKPLLNTSAEVIIFPGYINIPVAYEVLKNTNIRIGAQNLYYEPEGAFTGEISARMLKPYCSYVLVGHSERRLYFGEVDESVRKKLVSARQVGLTPILCIGETREERDKGLTQEVLKRQLSVASDGMIIAYEPLWAISHGDPGVEPAKPEDAQEAHEYIRTFFNNLTILYGGSVKPSNIRELMQMPDIDGVLVGGASLTEGFAEIANYAS